MRKPYRKREKQMNRNCSPTTRPSVSLLQSILADLTCVTVDDVNAQTGYLNWFDLETRTRKLVYELLQPAMSNYLEEKVKLVNLTKDVHEKHAKRLSELEFVVFKKKGEESNIFTDIMDRFVRVETRTKERDQDLFKQIKQLEESTTDFRYLVNTVEESLKMANRQIETFQKRIDDSYQAFADSQSEVIG